MFCHRSKSNAVWADPVSTLRWVPLLAYAADGKPATCSKGFAVQWNWGIVRFGCGDFIRTRYRRRRFSTSSQEIWRTGDIHWPMNEVVRTHHCPYARIDNSDLRCSPRKQLALASKHCQGQPRQTRADRHALCRHSERSICTPKSCRIT